MDKPTQILIVDDDPSYLTLIEQILIANPSYRVLKAGDAREAMRVAEEHMPSLILCDYYMDGEDGFEFCRKIKQHPRLYDTMFILLSGEGHVEKKVEGVGAGADDFCTKPTDEEELLSRIHALLRIKALQEELKEEKRQLEVVNRELEDGFMGVIRLLTQIMGLRIPNAGVRGEKAAGMLEWMGRRLDLDESDRRDLNIAALLHEIGKITLTDEILAKDPADCGEKDREKYSQFPVMGRAVNLVEQSASCVKTRPGEFIESLLKCRGTVLDPHVMLLLQEYLRLHEDSQWTEGKKQVSLDDLQEGMKLAIDLYTGSGIKLLPKDSVVHLSSIEKIRHHHHYDPIINGIYVYA